MDTDKYAVHTNSDNIEPFEYSEKKCIHKYSVLVKCYEPNSNETKTSNWKSHV